MRQRRLLAGLVAVIVFGLVIAAAVAILPWALGLLYGCVPPVGNCGDSVGWAMLISAPVTLPLILVVAGGAALATYLRVTRIGPS